MLLPGSLINARFCMPYRVLDSWRKGKDRCLPSRSLQLNGQRNSNNFSTILEGDVGSCGNREHNDSSAWSLGLRFGRRLEQRC